MELPSRCCRLSACEAAGEAGPSSEKTDALARSTPGVPVRQHETRSSVHPNNTSLTESIPCEIIWSACELRKLRNGHAQGSSNGGERRMISRSACAEPFVKDPAASDGRKTGDAASAITGQPREADGRSRPLANFAAGMRAWARPSIFSTPLDVQNLTLISGELQMRKVTCCDKPVERD